MKAIIKNKIILNEIHSASAIELIDNQLFIIGDNSPFLFVLDLEGNVKNKVQIFDIKDTNVANNENIIIIPKKEKPDFEASCVLNINQKKHLFVVGSGSSDKRNLAVLIDLETFEVKKISLKNLYKLFTKFISLSINAQNDELNIEGLCANHRAVYFFQRGNISGNNFIFSIFIDDMINYLFSEKQSINIKKINKQKVALPSIEGIFSGFSGAYFADNQGNNWQNTIQQILWTSSVENTKNAIDDGKVLGSFVGTYNIHNQQVENSIITEIINQKETIKEDIFTGKVEGICATYWADDLKQAIAVTDADGGCSEMLFIEIS